MTHNGGDLKEAKGRGPNCGLHLHLIKFYKCDIGGQMEIADFLLEGSLPHFTEREMNLAHEFYQKQFCILSSDFLSHSVFFCSILIN